LGRRWNAERWPFVLLFGRVLFQQLGKHLVFALEFLLPIAVSTSLRTSPIFPFHAEPEHERKVCTTK
jgi:hypothetical protein